MGTLYDLLGALPSDDAEALRTAFRKAAKATHPDINSDNPDAALRFRELMRAYDILTDTEQRATYDQLLTIALLPPPASANSTRTYEVIGKVASNTVAATIISAVLVGGYVVFGLFSEPPVAAEMEMTNDKTAVRLLEAFATALPGAPAQNEAPIRREAGTSAEATIAAAAVAPAANEVPATSIGRFEPVPGFVTYNLAVQHYPRFATTYFDRGIFLYRFGDFDRPLADIVPARRAADLKKTRSAAPAPRKPLLILPPVPAPDRRTPITAALTP